MVLHCIDTMLAAWNERDTAALRKSVEGALSPELVFCDPHNDIQGHAAFIAMVEAFWAKHGACRISRTSRIDAHHDVARYSWAIDWPDGRRFEGFDVVRLDLSAEKVRRVDGFFGPLAPA